MKSPFPGMDPYLEEYWPEVHHALCTYTRDFLQPQLTGGLRARIDERLVVEAPGEEDRAIYPDVLVEERRGASGARVRPAAGVALAEPLLLEIRSERARQGFIEIVDTRRGSRVITVIEFVSLSNRIPGPSRQLYVRKQEECQAAGISLVEIDLVRAGSPVTLGWSHLSSRRRTTHNACVWRSWEPMRYEWYPIPLESLLPSIRVPLRKKDQDARLDLQALIDRVYENGAYGQDIDYGAACVPALETATAKWVEKLMRAAKKRRGA